MLLEGFISVKAAIKSKNRTVHTVYISNEKRSRKSSYMKKLCTEEQIPFEFVSSTYLSQIVSTSSHGGFAAEVDARRSLGEGELLDNQIYYYFIGVEDPYNIATNIRTVYAAGADGIILDKRDYDEMRLSKSSAGTFEYINLHYTKNPISLLEFAKQIGYKIISIDITEESTSIFDLPLPEKVIFVIGGEKRGINSSIHEISDEIIHIPYGRTFGYALPSTIATSVVAFDMLRRIQEGDKK